MNINDIRLMCLKNEDTNKWTVYPEGMSGIVVEVEDISKAPKKLATAMASAFEYALYAGQYFTNEKGELKTKMQLEAEEFIDNNYDKLFEIYEKYSNMSDNNLKKTKRISEMSKILYSHLNTTKFKYIKTTDTLLTDLLSEKFEF